MLAEIIFLRAFPARRASRKLSPPLSNGLPMRECKGRLDADLPTLV
jgi:hypothetical protein